MMPEGLAAGFDLGDMEQQEPLLHAGGCGMGLMQIPKACKDQPVF